MLNSEPLFVVFVVIGLLGGWLLARVTAWLVRKQAQRSGRTAHRMRSLQAELRVAARKAEEAELALEREREAGDELKLQITRLRARLEERAGDLAGLQEQLATEQTRTQALRQELIERAEESVRARLRARDAETELSVVQAGSDVVVEQVRELAIERQRLNHRLALLEAQRGKTQPKIGSLPLRDLGHA